MKAAVVRAPGGPEVLRIEQRAVPGGREDSVLVRVRGFGLNRSELITRAGGSGDAVRFPRVLGIECVGEVVDAEDIMPGTKIMAAMGGMGRDFDGGYEQYVVLPAKQVIPIETSLEWPILAALPETFGTAWGSLALLGLETGGTLLVRGATSSVGMAATTLAHDRGVRVIATTRQASKRDALLANGASDVVIDDGAIAARVRELVPGGADALLELVGPATIADSLDALRDGGSACLTGFLADDWNVERATSEAAQRGLRLERYSSSVITRDAYGEIFREIVAGVEAGRYRPNLDRTFALDDIVDAHRYMESNAAVGKVVGVP
jgi:NADPH:quinone reductase-like Zn-dependent oxidoreductase